MHGIYTQSPKETQEQTSWSLGTRHTFHQQTKIIRKLSGNEFASCLVLLLRRYLAHATKVVRQIFIALKYRLKTRVSRPSKTLVVKQEVYGRSLRLSCGLISIFRSYTAVDLIHSKICEPSHNPPSNSIYYESDVNMLVLLTQTMTSLKLRHFLA